MSLVLNGTDGVTFNDASLQGAAASPYVLKNRIINGDMVIDQRNAGASVNSPLTASLAYTLDRWEVRGDTEGVFSIQQNSSAPNGFVNSLKITVTTIDSSLGTTQLYNLNQKIEGTNVSDFGFGTANAKTVTLSFWVRSSVTGTFGGSLRNSASNRAYPFSYTISVADTWEQKTVTIAGDTSGTWLTTTGIGINLTLSFGAGTDRSGTAGAWVAANNASATGATNLMATLNATWYVTGVQLEIGTSATPFERRLYGQEFINCQRYFYIIDGNVPSPNNTAIGAGFNISTTSGRIAIHNPVEMRSTPTFSYTGTIYLLNSAGSGITITSISATYANKVTAMLNFTVASGMVAGNGTIAVTNNGAGQTFQASAEL